MSSAPISRPVQGLGSSPRVPPLGRRLACLAYEGVLLFGVVFLAALIYSISTGQRHALAGRHGLSLVAFVLVPAVYFIGYWRKTGQTLPMQTWQIRLQTASGSPIELTRATTRFAAGWVWLLPPIIGAAVYGAASLHWLLPVGCAWIVVYALSSRLHPSRQFWHDLACGTRLVDTRPAPTL